MPALRFVALKSFPVQMPDGERRVLEIGDYVPDEVHGPWLALAQESGKVAAAALLKEEPILTKSVRARAKAAA